jgi:hypothetical protein
LKWVDVGKSVASVHIWKRNEKKKEIVNKRGNSGMANS